MFIFRPRRRHSHLFAFILVSKLQASLLFFCFRFNLVSFPLEVRFAEHSSGLKDLSPGSLLSWSEAYVLRRDARSYLWTSGHAASSDGLSHFLVGPTDRFFSDWSWGLFHLIQKAFYNWSIWYCARMINGWLDDDYFCFNHTETKAGGRVPSAFPLRYALQT